MNEILMHLKCPFLDMRTPKLQLKPDPVSASLYKPFNNKYNTKIYMYLNKTIIFFLVDFFISMIWFK